MSKKVEIWATFDHVKICDLIEWVLRHQNYNDAIYFILIKYWPFQHALKDTKAAQNLELFEFFYEKIYDL